MFLDGKPVDSIPVTEHELLSPGYVSMLQVGLEEKNEDIIDLSTHEPLFFIDALPSRMNDFEKKITKH